MDELVVQMETAPGMEDLQVTSLKKRLGDEFKKVLGVRVLVQTLPPGTLERTQFKARRLIDKRGLYEEMVGKK
jgi:phenylacetate-CoA ligase